MKKMSYDFSSRCHLFSMWIVPQASTRLEYCFNYLTLSQKNALG
jgi:hypothetical protein